MRVPPDADDLQASAFVQLLVIGLGAMTGAEAGHEFPIEGGWEKEKQSVITTLHSYVGVEGGNWEQKRKARLTLLPSCALVRHYVVVDQDLGVALFHHRHDGLEDLCVDFIGPILDDGVKEVCTCAYITGELNAWRGTGDWTTKPHVPLTGCSVRKS